MKDIKNYLHLYLGCEMKGHSNQYTLTPKVLADLLLYNSVLKKLKPILRKLSDMTEEEKKYCGIVSSYHIDLYKDDEEWSFEQVRYLLSKHFDLFGLIESGKALDKNLIL